MIRRLWNAWRALQHDDPPFTPRQLVWLHDQLEPVASRFLVIRVSDIPSAEIAEERLQVSEALTDVLGAALKYPGGDA